MVVTLCSRIIIAFFVILICLLWNDSPSQTVQKLVDARIVPRKSSASRKRAERPWIQADLTKVSFVNKSPAIHDFGIISWKKHNSSLLSLFLSFVTETFLLTILNRIPLDEWIIHSCRCPNTLTVTISRLYEAIALQIYLIGKQEHPKRTRDRSTED